MRNSPRLLLSLTLALAACGGHGAPQEATPAPKVRPLAALAAQQVILTPTYTLRDSDLLGWTTRIARSRDYLKSFDTILESELTARGLGSQWIFPPALMRARKANPSYSVDPYALGAAPLRSPDIIGGTRLTEPLGMQLRTMVALQESARAVLLPVELRFDKDTTGRGVAVLRLALIDGRLGEVRWIGDVRSAPSTTFNTALLTSLATKVADMITAP